MGRYEQSPLEEFCALVITGVVTVAMVALSAACVVWVVRYLL